MSVEDSFIIQCTDMFKRHLQHPATFSLLETTGARETTDGYQMRSVFTGENAFGVPQEMEGLCTLRGERISASVEPL
jgi:hypothetical protein